MFGSPDFHSHDGPRATRPGAARWPLAAVFDCDGLLLDTAACWREAFEYALREDGRELDLALLAGLSGASVRTAAELLDVSPGLLRLELEAAFARARLQALPGAALLVSRLRSLMPLGVATNGPESLVTSALNRVDLLDAFEAVVSAESEAHDKPAPHVYLAACARLGVDPSDAIAFEDSAIGVQAATRAGLTVVFVPSDPRDRAAADLRVSRLDDQRLFGLLGIDDARWIAGT
jgi:HAD superfamily hydrolase (TIGR01509 family)